MEYECVNNSDIITASPSPLLKSLQCFPLPIFLPPPFHFTFLSPSLQRGLLGPSMLHGGSSYPIPTILPFPTRQASSTGGLYSCLDTLSLGGHRSVILQVCSDVICFKQRALHPLPSSHLDIYSEHFSPSRVMFNLLMLSMVLIPIYIVSCLRSVFL